MAQSAQLAEQQRPTQELPNTQEQQAEARRNAEWTVRQNYTGRDQWAFKRVQEQLSAKEAPTQLGLASVKTEALYKQLRDFADQHPNYDAMSPEEKVQLYKLMDNARHQAQNAAYDAPNLDQIQRHWENAPTDFRQEAKQVEAVLSVLEGAVKEADLEKLGSGPLLADLKKIEAADLPPETRTKLATELRDTIARLYEKEKEVDQMAQQNKLPEHERVSTLTQYEADKNKYRELRQELIALTLRLDKMYQLDQRK